MSGLLGRSDNQSNTSTRRIALVTGAGSGIGKAAASLLEARGYGVIRADIEGTDIEADLATVNGRAGLVAEAAKLSGGRLDAVLAVAGVATPGPVAVAVNYFGMIATLEGLRPLLELSDTPRAAGVSSVSSLEPVDDRLVEAMTSGDEGSALRRAEELQGSERAKLIYASTKNAFSRWIRRTAPGPAWAGTGIPLNAVAPGVVATSMTARFLGTEEARARMLERLPMPLSGIAEPVVVARLLAWLVSVENSHLCGQVVFVDGGADAVIRSDSTW